MMCSYTKKLEINSATRVSSPLRGSLASRLRFQLRQGRQAQALQAFALRIFGKTRLVLLRRTEHQTLTAILTYFNGCLTGYRRVLGELRQLAV